MKNAADTITRGWGMGAIVAVKMGDLIHIRPAAFVFDLPDGWGWLEPSYADLHGPVSPSLHVRAGELEVFGDGLTWESPAQTIQVLPFDPEDDQGDAGYALIDWRKTIKSYQAERARMLEQVLASIS